MEQLFSTIDVARLLGDRGTSNCLRSPAGKLPEPIVIAGKRIYTSRDMERAKAYFRDRGPWQRRGKDNAG